MRERPRVHHRSAARRGTSSPARAGRRGLLALVAVAASAVLAACGTGAGGGAGAGSGRGDTQVTIGKAVDTIGFTSVEVAQSKGYFAKQGVGVKEEMLGGSSTAFAALQSGSVQFVTASSTALLSAKAKGVPLEAVTSLDYGVSLQLIASASWLQAHQLAANQPLKTVMNGMVGSTLGVISTTDLSYNHYLMQAAGVDPSQFNVITLKTQSAALAALQHGQIDSILLSPPNSYLAQEQGTAQIMTSLHSVPLLAQMTYDVLIVDSNYAKSHPDIVRSVATAMAVAMNLMAKDPNSVLDVEKQHYPSMSDQVLLQSLKYVTFAPDGKMTQEGWQGARTEAEQTGVSGASSVDVSPNGGTWTNDYIKTVGLSTG